MALFLLKYSAAQPLVSIFVPRRDEAGRIEQCSQSILAQDPPACGTSMPGGVVVRKRLIKEEGLRPPVAGGAVIYDLNRMAAFAGPNGSPDGDA